MKMEHFTGVLVRVVKMKFTNTIKELISLFLLICIILLSPFVWMFVKISDKFEESK
jgi:hypothetical protein